MNWNLFAKPASRTPLQVSERLGRDAKTYATDDNEISSHAAACLNFLAVICGTEDTERLNESARILNRFASEALEEYDVTEPPPEEVLRRLIERGIDITCSAMRERNWKVTTEGLSKLIFLDDLAGKVASGEEVLRQQPVDDWPNIVG